MDEVQAAAGENHVAEWIWNGYIARNNLTILKSLWKAGKTALIAGLLQRLADGGTFLGQACWAAKALVISEESTVNWAPRLALMPIGPHARLMTRPFLRRPTPELWQQLIDQAGEQVALCELDFVIVDSLTTFLPGRSDSATPQALIPTAQGLAAYPG